MGVAAVPEKENVVSMLLSRLATNAKYQFTRRDYHNLMRLAHPTLFALCAETGNRDIYPPGVTQGMLSSPNRSAVPDDD